MIPRTRRVRRILLISLQGLLASVWLAFGLLAKILNLVPRHRLIVAQIVGEEAAAWLTPMVGALEVLLAIWIVTGFGKRACAVAQTVAILLMNTCEILWARSYLLAPMPMVILNVLFLSGAWIVALAWEDPVGVMAPSSPGGTPARRE